MATMDLVDIGTLIERDPNFRGGRPCIAGTGMSVRRVVGLYKRGYSPEEIVRKYGHLNLAQIHAAIAYYYANQAEMDTEIAAEEAEEERLEKEFLADRSKA